ncbi:hypothetical protein CBR_g29717 [Chara braunii]|uniref:CCHC-type domain-containing protein n=1 Tax=Chara braunii TaxID=69332 RepID=A0A388LB74_CHABU|nr:hypothetical protein CBR_g29717 [Chara braunii]|eukprot:GBG79570.1 hypothetical protein CBR_g29717 [Chara braunii]
MTNLPDVRTCQQVEERKKVLLARLEILLSDLHDAGDEEAHVRSLYDLEATHAALVAAETGTEVVEVQGVLIKCRQALDKYIMDRYIEVANGSEKKEQPATLATVNENMKQLEEALVKERIRKEELEKQQKIINQQEQRVQEIRQNILVIGEDGQNVSLPQLITYLAHLETRIEQQGLQIEELTAGLRTVTNLVKGKNKVEKTQNEEKPKKLMSDAMTSLRVATVRNEEYGGPSDPSNPPPNGSPKRTNENTAQLEKPKKKEKVKMKLPFTFSNKKDENLLLWIAEIQTYVGTTPVEEESQVAFSTSCLGGEAKEWVLAEANAAGFDDIGKWAGTMTLKQFLNKIKERFLDKTTADKAFDQLTNIGQRHWTSVEALSREVDRLLQVPGLNLHDDQVLYIYARALPEPIRGQLVVESKSGTYKYRQFRDLALQREQMTSQVKQSYASVVKSGGHAGTGKRVLWRQKRANHTLVVFDDDTVEKWPLEVEGVSGGNGSGKGEVVAAMVKKGGPKPGVRRRPRSFPAHPGIAAGKPWERMDIDQKTWQERMDNAQCLKCGTAGHVIAWCPLIRNPKVSRQ